MSDDKIDEIRKRHNDDERYWEWRGTTHRSETHEDRGYLLAEVERLRAEVDHKRKSHAAYAKLCEETENRLEAAIERLIRERDEARAESRMLRAERDTLLLAARDFVRWFDDDFGWPRYPHMRDDESAPDRPWRAIHGKLLWHSDTLAALDGEMAKTDKEGGR